VRNATPVARGTDSESAARDLETEKLGPRRSLMEKVIRIFTDGSAIGNPGPGGWGAVLMQGHKRWEMSGVSPWTTISEMELVAAIQPLRSLSAGARVELSSDSELLIHGVRFLTARWQSQGWRNRRGVCVQHRERWEELISLNSQHQVRWRWLKGHNRHPIQCRVDALAYQAARRACSEQKKAA
jgi:ribonuclease HI